MVEAIQILFMNVLVSESFALFSKLFSAHIDQPLACHNWCWMYRLRFFAVSFPINQIRRIPFLWTTVYKYSLFFRLRFFNSAIKWLFVFARIQAIIDCGCLLQNECEEHNTSDYCICAFDRNSFCQHFFFGNFEKRETEGERKRTLLSELSYFKTGLWHFFAWKFVVVIDVCFWYGLFHVS